MKLLNVLEKNLSKIFKLITAVALFVQMFIVFIGVIARYFFNNPQPWIDEISTYLLVIITYLGGYVALYAGQMAGITFIRDIFPPVVRKILAVISDLLILVLMVATAYYGLKLCTSPIVLNQKTPTLQIPVIVFYCFVPISGALMGLSIINKMINHIRGTEIDVEKEGAYTE